jgi:hypothetical protein
VSTERALEKIRQLLDEPDASFEIKMVLINNSVIRVIVTRLERDTYLITIWQNHRRVSRHLSRHMVFNYLDQFISNLKPQKVLVFDLRRTWY